MSKVATRKELFTVLGTVVVADGRKRFLPMSPGHLQTRMQSLPQGKKLAATFYDTVATRSGSQLAYYHILVQYIADECGYTHDECHDALMRLKFGTKTIELAGRSVEVRRSVSDAARMPKYEMVELVEYALEVCAELGIYVPTREELGYLPK